MSLASLLKGRMADLRLTQQKVADQVGVWQTYISAMLTEKQKSVPFDTARALMRVLGIGFDEMLPYVTGGELYGYTIPLLANAAAGPPRERDWEADDEVRVHEWYGADAFAVRVVGQSMRDEAILNGDVLVVRNRPEAEFGDVVVAWVPDEHDPDLGGLVVKKKTRKPQDRRSGVTRPALVPRNLTARSPTIYLDERPDVRILGVYQGLIRKG